MRIKTVLHAVAMMATAALVWAPTALAWGEYTVTTPGAYILSTAVDQNGNSKFCTAGFIVRTPDGAPSSLPINAALDGRPVVRVMTADDVRRDNPVLCKSGARTGLSCGPITEVTPNTVSFRAWDDLGDSGAPVYVIQPDNTVAAVGILYAHSDDAQGRIIHATLVAPTMRDWGLSLW